MTTATTSSFRARAIPIDRKLDDFLAALPWPSGVPAPRADIIVASETPPSADAPPPRLRFVTVPLEPFDPTVPVSTVGSSPFEMIAAIGLLSEAWVRRHGADPGVYPTGIKAAIVNALDLRTAAEWVYSIQLAAVLAPSAPAR